MLTQERLEWTTCERGVRPDATAIANEAGTRRRAGRGRLRVLSGACEIETRQGGLRARPVATTRHGLVCVGRERIGFNLERAGAACAP
jgi:hypothetical protein